VQYRESIKDFIKINGEKHLFKTGESIFSRDKENEFIFLVEKGETRSILKDLNRITTLKKDGPGFIVGLASLISMRNCEEVRASSNISTIKIKKLKLIKFLEEESLLEKLIKTEIFPEEIAQLIDDLLINNLEKKISLKTIFSNLKDFVKVLNNEIDISKAIKKGDYVFINAKVFNGKSYKRIKSLDSFSKIIEHFSDENNLRVISFDKVNFIEYEKYFKIDSDFKVLEDKNGLDKISKNISKNNFINNPLNKENINLDNDDLIEENIDAFKTLSEILEIPFKRETIERFLKNSYLKNNSAGVETIGQIAISLGLHAVAAKIPSIHLVRIQTPSFIKYGDSFSLITKSNENAITICSSKNGNLNIKKEEIEQFLPEISEVILIEKSNLTKTKKFGVNWFIPIIKKYKNVLIQVLLASFVIQLFSLSSPLIIQLIIDKVINQRSLDTLQVLGIALILVTFLEGILGSLKTFLFTDTTNRIDQRLGSEVIDHLLRLPLNYFDKRPVGELSSRISELEKIRNFLTGQAMSTILDALFSIIYIVVMFFYSAILTLVALAVIPIQIAITFIGAPLFRRQYRRTAEENAKTQSHLVEILSGVQTVKAQNAEVVSRWKWQDLYSNYISRTFEQTITGTVLIQLSQVLQKVSQLLVLWVGAKLVLDGYLSLGQLIAFRIISGYVTQPVLRLSTIWQNIQELKISFERLGDVLETPQESDDVDKDKIPLPEVKGNVKFENVSFSFRKTGPRILDNLELKVEKGQFVGIVGQSGSGKSTLMKLLPRLYSPDQGKIFIDDIDIDKVELYSLRSQIGVVPQEPLLFSGTINQNISLTQPDATSEEIIKAAKIADAHDFIMKLPDGYSSQIGERATTLSGGQKQRIAIARTILGNPRILIMDEATSALDYKTEKAVCDNLANSLSDKTLFFITHRLSTVRYADLIILMENGRISEMGKHDELMIKKGQYFELFSQQQD